MGQLKGMLEKLQWVHVALIVGLSAAFFYFTLDQTEIDIAGQGIISTQEEIKNLQKKIGEAKDFEQQFAAKKKRYAELVKELQQLQGALPKQFFLPDLLSDLLREAKQLEVEIISIKPDAAETPDELYNSLGFSIEAKGTFLQFFIFLDRLANMKRLVSVQNFTIERDGLKQVTLGGSEGPFSSTKLTGGSTVYPGIKGNVRVVTYRYREKPAVDTAGTTGAAPDPGKPAPKASNKKGVE